MRYFVNLEFWKKGGPVFVFLGGEGPASKRLLTTGIMYEMARETRGAMYATEHRYYGRSKPVRGTAAEDFRFLSARQALADVARLIRRKREYPHFADSKFVVVGGSYAGNLAAWARALYPELVDAAVASSGPVLAKKDFREYLEKVRENYEHYGGAGCLDRIRAAFARYETLLGSADGIDRLREEEGICPECDMTVPENQQVFFISKASPYMIASQYGTVGSVAEHCAAPAGNSSRSFPRSGRSCSDYSFAAMIEEYRAPENDWALAWTYQTCTEFGYFQTTASPAQPFRNVPLSLYVEICEALFGAGFDEARVDAGVEAANALYGGRAPNVSRVVFSNGDMDPWSSLGVLEDVSYEAPAVLVPRASHCRDLFSDGPVDHEELKQARMHIKYLIKTWIGAAPYV
ncbi:putative serine protease K12H4.7 [Aricia agestis]|uniref:putative serine protease K12H4.7 n=1 Tax=Aricia agestis TaxID=91739 RepID=UPI001C20AAF2|nr:putative serine protease K12H4.7 [Aricia agestis]